MKTAKIIKFLCAVFAVFVILGTAISAHAYDAVEEIYNVQYYDVLGNEYIFITPTTAEEKNQFANNIIALLKGEDSKTYQIYYDTMGASCNYYNISYVFNTNNGGFDYTISIYFQYPLMLYAGDFINTSKLIFQMYRDNSMASWEITENNTAWNKFIVKGGNDVNDFVTVINYFYKYNYEISYTDDNDLLNTLENQELQNDYKDHYNDIDISIALNGQNFYYFIISQLLYDNRIKNMINITMKYALGLCVFVLFARLSSRKKE